MKTKQAPFYLLTAALFLSIISPNLLSDGMFMDGLLYAAISNNLAHGLGSFWDLFLTHSLYPHFHEHPPLAFGLQGLCIKIFGDSLYIERIYSFSTFIITGFIITRIWTKITDAIFHKLVWLPLLFWILIPLVTWSASNNMLENTMMIFTSLSVLFLVKSTEEKRVLNLVLAGVMLALGVLTKGVVALFPLSLMLWFFLFKENIHFKRACIDLTILIFSLIVPFVLLFVFIPESYGSLEAYFNKQIIGSITEIQTVDSRFFIVRRLFKEVLPIIIILFIVWLFTRKHKAISFKNEWFFIFLAAGLSGVIPVMISMKQSGFYILATFPLFSIAFALLIMQNVNVLFEKIAINSKGFKFFTYFSYMLLLVTIALNVVQTTKIGRDKDKIEDVYAVIDAVSEGAILTAQPDLAADFSLQGYFQRYGNITLDSDTTDLQKYFLITKTNRSSYLSNYVKTAVELNRYDLYEKIEQH